MHGEPGLQSCRARREMNESLEESQVIIGIMSRDELHPRRAEQNTSTAPVYRVHLPYISICTCTGFLRSLYGIPVFPPSCFFFFPWFN